MQLSRPVAGIIRPTTPKSPVHSTIFEDVESSEEEDQDLQELNDEDEQMIGANGDVNMKIKPNSEEVYGLVSYSPLWTKFPSKYLCFLTNFFSLELTSHH